MKETYKLAIVDDDTLVTALLAELFEQSERLEVIITAENGKQFIEELEKSNEEPDIVLLDLRMDEMDGLATMEFIRKTHSHLKIAVLSSFYQPSSISFMLKSGATAFQPKGILPEDLLKIVIEVGDKGFYFSEEQIEMIRHQLPTQTPDFTISPTTSLTSREIEVLELICQQKTAKEIGDKLFISQRTVEGHRNSLLLKTGVKNTAGLVIFAIQKKLIDPDTYPNLSL